MNPKDAIGRNKVGISSVPCTVLFELGAAMMEGARKYGRHNWRVERVSSSVYYDAAQRHLMAWWEGEDTDPDSGISHVTKAIASLVVLRDSQMLGCTDDDRPPVVVGFIPQLNEIWAEYCSSRPQENHPPHTQLELDALAT